MYCALPFSGMIHAATPKPRDWMLIRNSASSPAILSFPGFTAPKLLWVKENEPEIFVRIKKILLPKDYLRLWLTGEHVSEMSDASGTSWLDVAQRKLVC